MKGFNRRRFLQVAGAGSIAAASASAAAIAPMISGVPRITSTSKQGSFTFRAVTGMPSKPLPSYATYVIEGHVNLSTRTGFITKSVFAGAPEMTSAIALPGLSRIIRITDVQNKGGVFHLKGVVDDRSQLQRGESPYIDLLLDPGQHTAKTNLSGADVILQLEG